MAVSPKMQAMIRSAQKKFGENSVLIADQGLPPLTHYTTGSFMIDRAIKEEGGGIPEGKIIEVYGPESAGKTTFCFIAIAERQRLERQKAEADPNYQEKACLFVDAEHGFSRSNAISYGVDLESLIYVNPTTAEDAIDILEGFTRTGEVALAVVDSVPALTPSVVEEQSISKQTMALVARLMSVACTKLNGVTNATGASIIFINQIREKVGVMYGNPETTPGGRALKYYSWCRIKITRGEDLKIKDEIIGHELKVHLIKNRSNRPKTIGKTDLIYGVGYSREKEMVYLAMLAGVVIRGGAWYSVIDPDTGEILTVNDKPCKYQGEANLILALQENPSLFDFITQKVHEIEFRLEEEDVPSSEASEEE